MIYRCRRLADDIDKEIEASEKALDRSRVPNVAIVGPPNVGKSTLMNFLAGEDLSIVSPWAGTTRDTIRGEVRIGGHKLDIFDTAGIRETHEPIEKMGIERSL